MNSYTAQARLSRVLFAIVAMIFLSASFGGCTPSDAKMETAIKNVLEKNPKILQEAMKKAQPQRQAQPELPLEDRIKAAIPVDLNDAPVMGPADAPITIVTFSDFQCPFCKRTLPTEKALIEAYPGKIKFAFRQHPLPMHKNAMSAAKASLAAHAQGKFWQMHAALFEEQKDLSNENIPKIAQKVGLNMAKFKSDWKSTKFDAQIQKDLEFAEKSGSGGTPAFFINGVALKGARPIESFKEIIDKLLETKGAAPAPVAVETQPKQG